MKLRCFFFGCKWGDSFTWKPNVGVFVKSRICKRCGTVQTESL